MIRFHYDSIDSTNCQARRLAEQRPGERLLVAADEQFAGRGRQGRFWRSPRGGAWMSLAWPMVNSPRQYAGASLVAAVAVRRAIISALGAAAAAIEIKWPNDLLICDRKVAGILCEQKLAGAAKPSVLIVGVGVNVDFDAAHLASTHADGALRHPATTLRSACGVVVPVSAVVDAVADHLEDEMERFEQDGLSRPLVDELRANLAYVGATRPWSTPNGVVTGRVIGLDDAGRLLLDIDGATVACEAGEFACESDLQ
jgi:BirA family biotin operon repressor/biotin-[acetyl-CoA-carboxylase] ligase